MKELEPLRHFTLRKKERHTEVNLGQKGSMTSVSFESGSGPVNEMT